MVKDLLATWPKVSLLKEVCQELLQIKLTSLVSKLVQPLYND